jgi:hypothetical protein
MDESKKNVVRSLPSVPANEFSYAPDALCLAKGCEVRLITNIDTSAGLVKNSLGRVVQIIYDNADTVALVKGEHPPAYCVIVYFPQFRGFVSKSSLSERYYPFTSNKLVPVYRRRFHMEKLPECIRKVQEAKFCYRGQFTIDLSSNLTVPRDQG